MYKLSNLIILGALVLSFSALIGCQQNATEQSNEEKKEEGYTDIGEDRSMEPESEHVSSNLTFTHHVKNNTHKPEVGEVVYYHYVMRTDLEVIRSSYTNNQLSYFQIPDPSKVSSTISPMLQGLMKMSLGDSLTVEQPLPDDAYRPESQTNSKVLYYDLSLREVKSMEAFQADIKNKK